MGTSGLHAVHISKFPRCDVLFMIGTAGFVNRYGTNYANVISRPGRNELQFHSLVGPDQRPSKIELSDDLAIVAACWFVENASLKQDRGKKRKQDDSTADADEHGAEYFVVGHQSGRIAVFSAHQESEVNSFHFEVPVVAMCAGEKSVVCVDKDLKIIEVSVTDGKKSKPKSFKDIDDILALEVYADGNRKQNYILGTQDVNFVDPSKPKNFLVKQVEGLLAVESISKSAHHANIVYVVRKNDDKIYVYDTETLKERTLKASGSVSHLHVFAVGNEEVVFAVSTDGIEVFEIDFEADFQERPPACLIKTLLHDSESEVRFSAISYANNDLIGIWHKALQPCFEKIDWRISSVGEITVPIDGVGRGPASQTQQDTTIVVPEQAQIKNLPSDELLSTICTHVEQDDEDNILEVCSSNDDEASIKETVKDFSGLENGLLLITKLYKVISHEVSRLPDDTKVLATWLKWILLTHGGALSKNGELYTDFVVLQKGLSKGMEQMPQLLALQGRLHLLKAQAQLRDTTIEVEEPESFEKEVSVVYANGEDEDEDMEEESEEGE